METMEKATGMENEFGETFGKMIENEFGETFGEMIELGKDTINGMAGMLLNSFGGYVKDPIAKQKWFDDQKDLLPTIEGLEVKVHLYFSKL